ncbi:MAG: hypothetical protein DDT29_02463 [Dehalococcoidia bacterium]|nr:hypothetical protein [Bacillota bacterium]
MAPLADALVSPPSISDRFFEINGQLSDRDVRFELLLLRRVS